MGYVKRYIDGFARLAQPLNDLLKKDAKLKPGLRGNIEAQHAFTKLKAKLLSAPILRPPDWTKTFILATDGSSLGPGGLPYAA